MERTEKIEILRQLVKIQSVNGNELPVAKYLKQLFDQAGISCQILPAGNNRANLVAEIGTGKPVLAISGHMDTVAVTTADWDQDPFTLTTKGDQLIGRGACDMKGGLAALVIAMIELKANKVPLVGTIRLLATYGEEFAEQGAADLTTAGYMKDVTALMIAEPSAYHVCYAQAGSVDITLTSKGKTAHSSMPQMGSNAVAHLVNALYQIQTNVTKLTAGIKNDTLNTETLFNIDVFHGGNQVNTIPNLAKAQISMRTIPEISNDALINTFKTTLAQYNAENDSDIRLHVEMSVQPVVGDPEGRMLHLIQKMGQPYLAATKFTPAEEKINQMALATVGLPANSQTIPALGAAGGTDARQFLVDQPLGADYTVFGPGNFTSHQANESLSAKMYLDFIKLYEALFPAYLNGEG
ncbi:ArgE/DapE family deacylase [Lactiplantibacillus sp. WILCCON 0030]|uniref:Probable succinyl-diaminopimelate desuccinylase n=1 Tax=Lactiplantibacillus brownii TaxID=3069269 RepID=A0ABU1ACY4_9LACO|nr:ArgE/DapE family deacylase [Lactiplantibacillus brownii]MDQ7938505.1 ArgE/DapE family deacylase [Lactiplantibacillus brownii]